MQLKPQLRGLPVVELGHHIHPTLGDTIMLKSGKKIGYLEFGDPSGIPIFYFHGGLSSRIEAGILAENAAKNGLRLIGLDRPGVGLSDPMKAFTFIDWPAIVVEIADALGIERFSVCGTSGGGAFACACGAIEEVSKRMNTIILIAGMLPTTPDEKKLQSMIVRLNFPTAKYIPLISFAINKLVSKQFIKRLESDTDQAFKEMDKVVKPGYSYMMANSILSGQLQGQKANIRDLALYAQPLGFELNTIKVPVLALSGLKDRNVPSAIADRVVCEVHCGRHITYEEADHGSIFKQMDDMVEQITFYIHNQIDGCKKKSS
ncbi:alpha/beta hydrolase [Vallitalea pronyensis]|uniref:Alpha/beta hydrolase n=1 Tax=Vallitalea pronyensis TaxID=1348613 RepID=A0A8J8MNN4_9FIRM|nr:alpha/beta hydrolase [Vallitalea pronyensis]QUI24742.1 alpha/beta hydrolase [Vallitalea pronyensis]